MSFEPPPRKRTQDRIGRIDNTLTRKADIDPENRVSRQPLTMSQWISTHLGIESSIEVSTQYADLGTADGTSSINFHVSGQSKHIQRLVLANPSPLVFGITSDGLLENSVTELCMVLVQDATGGRMLGVPSVSAFRHGSLLNEKLDTAPNAQTMFRFVTIDGGQTWDVELVGLDAGVGSSMLEGLTDVELGTVVDGDVLSYDDSLSRWTNRTLADLMDMNGDYGDTNVQAFIEGLSKTFWDNLTNLGNSILDALRGAGDAIYEALGTLGDWLQDLAGSAVEHIRNGIMKIGAWIGNASTVPARLLSWLQTVPASILSGLSGFVGVITGALGRVWTLASEWFGDAFETIRSGLETIGNWFNDAATVPAKLLEWIRTIPASIISGLSGFVDIVTGALGTAWTRAQEWFGNAFNVIRSGLETIGEWFNDASDVPAKLLEWIQTIPASIIAGLSGFAGAVTGALGVAWTNLNMWFADVGSFVSNLATNTYQAIIDGLGTLGDWLNTIAGAANNAIRAGIRTIGNWVGTATSIPAVLEDWIKGLGATFWGSITHIGTLITNAITNAWDMFWDDLGISGNAPADLANIVQGVADYFTNLITGGGGGGGDSTTLALRDLSNLNDTNLNAPLTFNATNTNTGPNRRNAIGADGDSLYFKTRDFNASSWHFQAGNSTNIMQLSNRSIRLFPYSGGREPQSNGEIVASDSTIKVRVNGVVKDLADIGTGSGGGTPTDPTDPTDPPDTSVPPGFTQLTDAQRNAGATWIPVASVSSTNTISTSQLDGLFGSALGSIGVLRPTSVGNGSGRQIFLAFRSPTHWIYADFNTSPSSSTQSNTGVRSSNLNYPRRSVYITTGNGRVPSTQDVEDVVSNPSAGDFGAHYEDGDEDDGALWFYNSDDELRTERREDGVEPSLSASGTPATRMPKLPVMDTYNGDPVGLEAVFGVDDGAIGIAGDRLVIKIQGYWFTINF